MNWISIESLHDFEQAVEMSKNTPVLIFKHSTRCPVSFMAKRKIQGQWNFSEDEVKPYFLDLIKFREVSQQIADFSGVIHESPQALLFKNETVIYSNSHHDIETADFFQN